MGAVTTHYPGYNVLDRLDEWDSHTREIVRRRLGPFTGSRFFTGDEARGVAAVAGHIIYDDRRKIIDWIVHHLDSQLAADTGENQRQAGTPPEKVLLREGLKSLDRYAQQTYGLMFADLEVSRQFDIMAALQQGKLPQPVWGDVPQKQLFKKLAGSIVSAYYSHPAVWSEIGYGGPVYPQIYLRIELGLTEPWEAKRDGE